MPTSAPLTLAPHEAAFYLSTLLDMRAAWEAQGLTPSPMLQHQIQAVARHLYGSNGNHITNHDALQIRWEAEAHWNTPGDTNQATNQTNQATTPESLPRTARVLARRANARTRYMP